MKRHYSDFFEVPVKYHPNMTREAINETPETWLDFYPHAKYIEFLKTLFSNYVLNGGSTSLWLTGNYGTGKSNAALVTEKLFMDDEVRVCRWFNENKSIIDDSDIMLEKLLELRGEGTLVVFDYDASGVGANDDFLVRLERGIVTVLNERGYTIPAKSNLDVIIERINREDEHFFKTRDSMQNELAYLTSNIKTAKQLINELQKVSKTASDIPSDLLGDVQKVLHRDGIYLNISVDAFRTWIAQILAANKIKRIVYIFDEFSKFIENNSGNLKCFEDTAENPGINGFYLIPVTHREISSYWAEGSDNARKANDRFKFRNLLMPNDIAFKLAGHAIKPNSDPEIYEEWQNEKRNLWEAVKSILGYFSSDESSAEYVSRESFYEILPIHPMTAFLLKFLSESARSNQRSIFEYLKGSADGQEFQDFIKVGGPTIEKKQFLTADYLWKYFIERDDLGLNKEIVGIRSEFTRIRNNSNFCNKLDDDEDIRVLKAVLLFCLLERLLTEGAHDRLKPTVENIKLAFQGDSAIVNIEGIIKNLAEKHCFSVVNGNIELFASSVGNADLQNKIKDLKFHDLLSEKTADELRKHKQSDISKFSTGRFDIRVSDASHTTSNNIQPATRKKYSRGINEDAGTVCLWFVVAKNKEESLQIPEKIKRILTNYKDHRIIMFAFPNLTFCDTNLSLWDDYAEQVANYMLDNSSVKVQYQQAYERIEKEWFSRLKEINTQIGYYTFTNGQVEYHSTSWINFKDVIGEYVRNTLTCCVDYLAGGQPTAFETKAFKGWTLAGLLPDNASESKHKQMIQRLAGQGVIGDDEWFSQNPQHPIAQIRALFDKKISNTVAKGSNLSVRKVYIELQRAPYGLKKNAITAFVLGVSLRHILTKGYQWDNKQITGALDATVLAEIIETVINDDGDDKIKLEKEICRLSLEAKAFVEKAPQMFGVTSVLQDARVEEVLCQIQTQIEKVSGRVPLWILPEYIRSTDESLANDIASVLDNICLAFTISAKGKTEDRTTAINKVGGIIRSNPAIVDSVAKYINPNDFLQAFRLYVAKNANNLVSLATEIGDVSHSYCDSIKEKSIETSGWLWKESDISDKIHETTIEYEITKHIQKIAGISNYVSYKEAFSILREAITNKNKLPKTLISTHYPTLSTLLFAIANNREVSDIRDGLATNVDIIKGLFFDVTKVMTVEVLQSRLVGVSIEKADLLNIYNSLENGFSTDENTFLDNIRLKVEEFAKNSVSLKIKENWNRLTGTDTPHEWSIETGLPARFALGEISEVNDLLAAVETPDRFSADKLEDVLSVISELSPIAVSECQSRFITETVPRKFAKFDVNLSSLLEYLQDKYGKQPNNWPSSLDLSDFIRTQYKGTFAPQVAEKIKKTSAEDLKNLLLKLAQENPDIGLLFWE